MRKTECKGFSPTFALASDPVRIPSQPFILSHPASVRLIFPLAAAMMPALMNAGGTGCRRNRRVEDIRRGRSARRMKGHFAMNNWVLAAVLAAAALAMYVGIFVKIGG